MGIHLSQPSTQNALGLVATLVCHKDKQWAKEGGTKEGCRSSSCLSSSPEFGLSNSLLLFLNWNGYSSPNIIFPNVLGILYRAFFFLVFYNCMRKHLHNYNLLQKIM